MKKLWNILIILLPILIIYESPIDGISIVEILIILSIPYLIRKEIVEKEGNIKMNPQKIFCFLYISFILLNFFVNIIFIPELERVTVLFRTSRYLLYWMILLFTDHVKNVDYSIKIYEIVSVISIIFLILQIAVLKGTGYYIDGRLPLLPVMNPSGFEEQIEIIYTMGGRPFSFYAEPSVGAQYITGLLAIELFYKRKVNIKLCTFLSLGVLIMASNTGIFLMILLYVLYFGDKLRRRKIKFGKMIILFCAGIACVFICVLTNKTLANRIFNPVVWLGRFGGFSVFVEKFTYKEILFGHGMNDNYGTFMPGIPQFYYYFGYVGVAIMGVLLIWLYVNLNKDSRKLLLYILVLNLGGNMFFGQFIVTIWYFLKGKRKIKVDQKCVLVKNEECICAIKNIENFNQV